MLTSSDETVLVHNQDRCQVVAQQIQERIGGDIFQIGNENGRWPMGSTHPGTNADSWVYHEFVIENGLVTDEWVTEMPIDDYLGFFPGWSIDDLVQVG